MDKKSQTMFGGCSYLTWLRAADSAVIEKPAGFGSRSPFVQLDLARQSAEAGTGTVGKMSETE